MLAVIFELVVKGLGANSHLGFRLLNFGCLLLLFSVVLMVNVEESFVDEFEDRLEVLVGDILEELFILLDNLLDSFQVESVEGVGEDDSLFNINALSERFVWVVEGEVLDALPLLELFLHHFHCVVRVQWRVLKSAEQHTEQFADQVDLLVRFLNPGELLQCAHVHSAQSLEHLLLLAGTLLQPLN